MKKGYVLIMFVALLGIAFLFSGSAFAAVDFPADEADGAGYANAVAGAAAETQGMI